MSGPVQQQQHHAAASCAAARASSLLASPHSCTSIVSPAHPFLPLPLHLPPKGGKRCSRAFTLFPIVRGFISMYFIVKGLRRQIEIPPDKFGKHIDRVLTDELTKAVEGQIYPDFGAIVCVLNMRSIEELDGVLRDCLGTCVYNVEYEAIVCRIFEKEVLRGQVVSLSEVGVDIDIGPGCLGQVNRTKLPPMLDYDVQESVYRDKDGKPILHRNCNVRFEVTNVGPEMVLGKMSGKISLGREIDDM